MRIKRPGFVLLALFAVCGRSMAANLSEVCPYRSGNIALITLGGIARASSFTVKWEPEKAFDNVSWHFQAWYPDWWGDKTEFGDLMGRLRSAAPQRTFWFIPQAFGEGNLRLPEPAELRQMCWLAISHGFTGIVPFVYTTNMPDEVQIGLLGTNNRHTPAYDEFKRIFHDLQPLTPMLLKLKGTGRPIPAPPSVEAREFTGTDGKTYMVVVNRSVTERVQTTINKIHVELEPGDGALVKINK